MIPLDDWMANSSVATASSPEGDIYVAGMDHVSNAALYRLKWRERALQYVGDARSASEQAANWTAGETAEKFHTRPLWQRGKIYVGTMDRSTLDDDYLTRADFIGTPMIPLRPGSQT
jgi:hypothetical protein